MAFYFWHPSVPSSSSSSLPPNQKQNHYYAITHSSAKWCQTFCALG